MACRMKIFTNERGAFRVQTFSHAILVTEWRQAVQILFVAAAYVLVVFSRVFKIYSAAAP